MTMPQQAEPVLSRPAPRIEPLKVALVERAPQATRPTVAAPASMAIRPAVAPTSPEAPQDPDLAMALLTEVSSAMSVLQTRCDQLAGLIAGTEQQAESDLRAVNEEAVHWQQSALDLKAQVEHLTEVTAQFQRRAELFEAQSGELHSSSTSARQRAAEADALTALFRGTIVSSFGAGSRGSAALQVANGRVPVVTI